MSSTPLWRLADHDAGSDVGVTFAPPRAPDDYDCEPDAHVFSVHVWNNGTNQCREFAEQVCALMNRHGIKPPDGWDQ